MTKKQSPQTLFDALAEDYVAMRAEVCWDPFPHIEAVFADRDLEGLRVLDAGCGTGEVARWLAKRGASVYGLDISPEMCMSAAEASENIPFLPHDLSAPLPFEANSFDIVIALACLEYLPDVESCVAEFARVLADDGQFLGTFERLGHDCPGGMAQEVVLFDDWMRYRQSPEDIISMIERYFATANYLQTTGFMLEDDEGMTQYIRVLAQKS